MLFVSFFWAFFHSSLSPNVELAALWPHGINRLDPWAIPLLGSCVLLASGFILTLGHHALFLDSSKQLSVGFNVSVLLGVSVSHQVIFTLLPF
jgi:cytochrome c oxidase subunit 3